jgi:STAM-binding protein
VVLDTLEVLKPRINARYAAWEKAVERRREARITAGHSRSNSLARTDVAAASDPAVAGNTTTLGAAENSQLAVKLAHKEIRRRDAARRGTRKAGVTEQEEQERRTAGLWDDWEAALTKDGTSKEEDDVRRNMEASRRRIDGPHDIVPDNAKNRLSKPKPNPMNGSSEYRYPSISRSEPLQYQDKFESQLESPPPIPKYLPPKPPKERIQDQHSQDSIYELEPPPRPEKASIDSLDSPMSKTKVPQTFTFRPSAYLENGNPLRTVFLPPTLRTEFLRYAESNTRRNLETCGMLCGTLISNALFISRVVIPEQKNTSDTCEMINESDFFDYCIAEDLMCLGWIHTHPTQTCFMSSRDLHTHNAYQAMMAESIAIVCAPSKNPS